MRPVRAFHKPPPSLLKCISCCDKTPTLVRETNKKAHLQNLISLTFTNA